MMPDFPHWIATLLDALFPPICALCRKVLIRNQEHGACRACLNVIFTKPNAFTCPICRGRIPFRSEGLPPAKTLCHPEAGYLLIACSFYDKPGVQQLIWELKFKRHRGIATAFGTIAAEALQAAHIESPVLVPVPLSAQRLRERGFNQAALIATQIATRIGRKLKADTLRRIKNTEAQTTLKNWSERKKNLSGVFFSENITLQRNETLVLVDDVWTSGATMSDAVRAVREAGAPRTIGVVISRIR